MTLFRTFVCFAFLAAVGCAGMDLGEEPEDVGDTGSIGDTEQSSMSSFDSEDGMQSVDEANRLDVYEGGDHTAERIWDCNGDVCCRGCGGWPDTCVCCWWDGDRWLC
jgi:hypothetical protein